MKDKRLNFAKGILVAKQKLGLADLTWEMMKFNIFQHGQYYMVSYSPVKVILEASFRGGRITPSESWTHPPVYI